MVPDVARLQETIGISFEDQTLLQKALVHRSFLNENPDFALPSNERLEFLGDALLDFVVGEYLFERFPEMDEGDLTRLRAALIKAGTLAEFARSIRLGDYVYLSRGEDERGGRSRVGLLSDAFEALVAAIYMDRGLEAVKGFLMRFLERETTRVVERGLERDHKSRLQEWTQRELRVTPVYHTIVERGPDHAKQFTVEVWIGDKAHGRGEGRSKQAAEQHAAQQALEQLARGDV
ncbi:MAG: ribonuclease III [Chloroflexi bacterium B3_Chlor]|nr:MAG: ribonuclease III [Chloroflexi bacterium B3_Chlor]